MNNVIPLEPKKQPDIPVWNRPVEIWHCNCGCEAFYLHSNGAVECYECEKISTVMVCGEK